MWEIFILSSSFSFFSSWQRNRYSHSHRNCPPLNPRSYTEWKSHDEEYDKDERRRKVDPDYKTKWVHIVGKRTGGEMQ